MEIKNIAIIGAGTMGNGIAHVCAMYGYNVALIDLAESALNKALNIIEKNLDRMVAKAIINEEKKHDSLKLIKVYQQLEIGVKNADLAIEAVTENEQIKLNIFKELDASCPYKTVLASNTSSISITKIAAVTKRPDKVIGMHFMNPVPIMKLVEIIKGYETSEQTLKVVMSLSKALEKSPVQVYDYPGFIANRILIPMINESIYSLYEGVAGVMEIDSVMKLGMAHPMGPLQLADFIGLDVVLAITKVLYNGFGNQKYAPCPLLVNMVTAGKLGRKTEEGFYDYRLGAKKLVVSKSFQ